MSVFEVKDCISLFKDIKSVLVFESQMIETPVVTIVIPTYNHPSFLKEAILSAQKQDFDKPFEILIIDNKHDQYQRENQETIKSILTPNINYYVNEKNIGAAGNWNRGAELAKASLFVFCHDDDILTPNALSTLYRIHQKIVDKEAIVIGSHHRIDPSGTVTGHPMHAQQKGFEYKKLSLRDYIIGNNSNGCGCLFPKRAFVELGGYNDDFTPCPDYALNVLFTSTYGSYITSDETYGYRISDENDTRNCYGALADGVYRVQSDIIRRQGKHVKLRLFFAKNMRDAENFHNRIIYEGVKQGPLDYFRRFLWMISNRAYKLERFFFN